MRVLFIPYSTWSQVVDANSFKVYQEGASAGASVRNVWAGNKVAVYRAFVDGADLADYQAKYENAGINVEGEDDALARIIGLGKVTPAPETPDKKPIVVMYPAREGFNTWLTGKGDDVVTPARGQGTKIKFSFTAGEVPITKSIQLQFMEPIEVHDGRAIFGPTEGVWNSGDDWISLSVVIPVTPYTDRTVEADGNANKVPSGLDFDVFVPASGDGNTQLDMTAVCPVINETGTGYWDLDEFSGAVSPNVSGTGNADLLDLQVSGILLNEVPIGEGHRTFDIDVYKAEYVHQNWIVQIECHKETAGDGWLAGWLFCFREKVTP